MRRWKIDLGYRRNSLRDQPLFVRFKFHAASTNRLGTYRRRSKPARRSRRAPGSAATFAANSFHELRIAPNLVGSAQEC